MNTPTLRPAANPAQPRARRRGFALIVVMTLLALVVLMILSLVTMVQLSLQASKASVRQAQSQQNALLGVQIAMGQLAKFAGADQRATGTADLGLGAQATDPSTAGLAGYPSRVIYDPSNYSGLTIVTPPEVGTRQWTAVWGNSYYPEVAYTNDVTAFSGTAVNNPATPATTPTRPWPTLLNWLISGNEETPAPALASAGSLVTGQVNVSAPVRPKFAPSQGVTNLTPNTTALTSGLKIRDNTSAEHDAVLLVGPNTVGTAVGQSTTPSGNVTIQPRARFVVAPLVEVAAEGQAPTSRYAYWIGDEGVKAKYNIRNPYADKTNMAETLVDQETNYTRGALARFRLLAAPRNGIEIMAASNVSGINFSSYANLSNNTTASRILERVFSLAQTHAADTSTIFTPPNLGPANDPVKVRFHDLTTHSYGVLSDGLRGGLRYDLTTALDSQDPSSPTAANPVYEDSIEGLKGKFILPNGTGTLGTPTPSATSTEPGGPRVSPRQGPQWDIIKSFYDLSSLSNNSGVPVPIRPATATQHGVAPILVQMRLMFGVYLASDRKVYIATYPIVTLANPYNFAIRSAGGLDMGFVMNTRPPNPSGVPQIPLLDWGIGVVLRTGPRGGTTPNGNFFDVFNQSPNPVDTQTPLTQYVNAQTFPQYFPILKNRQGSTYAPQKRSVLDSVALRLMDSAGGNFTLQPGESRVYAMQASADVSGTPPVAGYTGTGTPPTSTPGGLTAGVRLGICAEIIAGNELLPTQPPYTVTLRAGPANDAFFLRDTGFVSPYYPSSDGWLISLLPSPACTVELRLPNNPPGSNVVKSFVNMDLTGNPTGSGNSVPAQSPYSPGASSPDVRPVPHDGYRRGYENNYPVFTGSYYFFLALPETAPLTAFRANSRPGGSSTQDIRIRFNAQDPGNVNAQYSNRVNFRTYADYNLRAANFALSPAAPLQAPPNYSGGLAPAATSGFPTIPPYGRFFDQGLGPDADASSPTDMGAALERVQFSGNLTRSLPGAIYGLWGKSTGLNLYVDPQGNPSSQSPNLVTHGVLYGAPIRASGNNQQDQPILSLGQLQGADVTADDVFSSVSYQPGNAIGNSWFTPYVARRDSFRRITTVKSDPRPIPNPGGTLSPLADIKAYDMSYLINTALWDRYYFSSIPQARSASAQDTPILANQRLKFAAGFVPTNGELGIGASSTKVKDLGGGPDLFRAYAPSRYLMIDGAFNINSTSVEAWKALLASLRNAAVSTADAGYTNSGSPFPRALPSVYLSANPTLFAMYKSNFGSPPTTFSVSRASMGNSESFMGFRRLTDTDIANLATKIVQQVRLRGPFLTLNQFVNRKLAVSTDPASRAGALQTAIDLANLNNLMAVAPNELVNFQPSDTNVYPDFLGASENLNRSTGAPGWLTQADLLQVLAPVLAARSDTFVVRAYGESLDALDGRVQSRTWCEAVVQRLPEYVDSSDNAAAQTPALDSPANRQFGRKFRLISLRWLSPEEI